MLHSKKIRDQKGAAITGLVIALMFFVLMAGLFAFDASRVQMAQRELTATCDASALAGTAMLTSYDVSNDPGYTKLANAQQNAAAYAYNMFNMGNVLGRFIQGNSSLVTDLASLSTTTDGQSKVVIGLVDPKQSYTVVDPTPPNNANGRAIAVFAGYGYHPIFISFYGVGNVGILASSIGGLPQVDAILVFDYSGSMDDLTKVTLIKRWWNPNPPSGGWSGGDPDTRGWSVHKNNLESATGINPIPGLIAGNTKGCVQYNEVPHPTTNQSILDYVELDTVNFLQGTSLNALPPQNLANSELGTLLTGDQIIVFKPFLRASFSNNDYSTPPGNCPAFKRQGSVWKPITGLNDAYSFSETSADRYPSHSGRSGTTTTPDAANIYTDMVVNIGTPTIPSGSNQPVQPLFGPDVFSAVSFTFPGSEPDPTIRGRNYNFNNLAALVEASRGNRETTQYRDGNVSWNNTWRGTGLHRGYFLKAGGVNAYFGPNSQMGTRRGYQKAYQRLAMWYSQPIASALDGADQGFFQKLSALADCRFGFVGFSDSDPFPGPPNPNSMGTPHTGVWGGAQGTSAYSGKNSFYLDINYKNVIGVTNTQVFDGRFRNESPNAGGESRPHENNLSQGGGQSGFRIPRAQLRTSYNQTESLNLVTKGRTTGEYPWSNPWRGDGLYNGRPLSGTMCFEALQTARLEFQAGAYDGLSRAGSKHAIVFFTDGIPSGGVGSTEATQSATVADSCASDGIAMFCIGLNMLGNSTLSTDQDTFLGNGSGGLSGRAKNGGRYFECNDVTAVKQAFSAIARRLTQSQR